MAALVNPGGGPRLGPSAPTAYVSELKDIVRSTLSLGTDQVVLIQQLACCEPGCPPVETVVAVMGSPRRSWKFAVPTVDVTPERLRNTLTNYPGGRDHDQHS